MFSVGGRGVYGRATNEGLSRTTLGMTGSMVVKKVLWIHTEKYSHGRQHHN